MNYACEITYPVGESLNGGIMVSLNQISGFIFGLICQAFIDDFPKKKYISNVFLILPYIVADIFVFLFDEKLDRQEVDERGRLALKEQKKDKTRR